MGIGTQTKEEMFEAGKGLRSVGCYAGYQGRNS